MATQYARRQMQKGEINTILSKVTATDAILKSYDSLLKLALNDTVDPTQSLIPQVSELITATQSGSHQAKEAAMDIIPIWLQVLREQTVISEKLQDSQELTAAVEQGNTEIIKTLLLEGANTNFLSLNTTTYCYETLLTSAAETNACFDSMRLLILAGAEPNALNKLYQSPLFKVVLHNNINAAEILLQYGAHADGLGKRHVPPLVQCADNGNG